MKKILLFLFLFLRIIDSAFSQNLYLKTGVNSTAFEFVDNKAQPLISFLPGIAPSFEIGYGYPISSFLVNEFGVSLDGYNSKGDTKIRDYDYTTFYGGIRNSTAFKVKIPSGVVSPSLIPNFFSMYEMIFVKF
jgi:hypothetical protein